MYPHERSLVEQYAGKPFTILGVNSDPKEKLTEVIESKQVTWRSFWDGGNTRGPIATRWNVSGWPTIYVIDHKGVIRFKNVREKALDAAIETLVKEAEGEGER